MTSTTKTGKFNKKILALILIIVVVSSVAAAAYILSQQSNSPSTLPSMSLTLIGSENQQKVLTEQDIAALESYSAQGGFKTSGGVISGVGTYTGVLVTDLLNLVGGMTSDQTLTVTASDGYTMDFTYEQVINGQDFPTYDPETGSEVASTQPMQLVVIYYLNGAALPSDEGPLRLGVLGSEGLLTNGHFWVKIVTQLSLAPEATATPSPSPSPTPTSTPTPTPASSSPTPTPTPTTTSWSIVINGATEVTMTQAQFETLVSQDTQTYTDSTTTWEGTPLYKIVDWATSNGIIDNSDLSLGYVVKVIGSDGYTKAFNDSRIDANNNIILANKANDTELSSPYYPITLTGSDLSGKEKVKGIAQIQILPIQHLELTLVAADGTQTVLFSNDLALLDSYTADGGTRSSSGKLANYGTYTGVPILTLLDTIGGVTSSNTVRVTASDDYATTYTYEQLNGQGITTYDSEGNVVTATQPLTVIVAYYLNGTNLDSSAGPLRIITVGPEGYYTMGNLSAKMTVKIEIL